MKMKRLFIFAIFILFVLHLSVSLLMAAAPKTAKILFTSARNGNYEVYSMNTDGSEKVNLTQHQANDLRAVWSPSGEEILFVSDRDGFRDLYLMEPDGSDIRRVFKKEVARWDATWAPDGKQIAYECVNWEDLTISICIATVGKQKEQRIVKGFYPAWSPNGTEIAYIAYVPIGHTRRVTFIDVHTRRQKRLLPKKAMDWQNRPSWSPAGKKLAFSWNKNPLPPDHDPQVDPFPPEWATKETIYIVNRDGTDLQQLVEEVGPKAWYPVLSAEGGEILYTQEVKGSLQIFKLDMHNGTRTQLTQIGRNFGGDWFDPAYALSVTPQPQLLTTTWGEVKQ